MFCNVLSIVYHQFLFLFSCRFTLCRSHAKISTQHIKCSFHMLYALRRLDRVNPKIKIQPSTLSIDRFYARSISCKHWNAFATKFATGIFFSSSLSLSLCTIGVLCAADVNMWKVINCNDKQQIVALASKSASVFIESSKQTNNNFVH